MRLLRHSRAYARRMAVRAQCRRWRRLAPWHGWWLTLADRPRCGGISVVALTPAERGALRKRVPRPLLGKMPCDDRRRKWRQYRQAARRAIQADRPIPRFRPEWAD